MVVVGFNLKIGDQMASEFINVMPPTLAKELVAGFFPQESGEPVEEAIPEAAPEPETSPAPSGGLLSQEEIEKLLGRKFRTRPPASAGN